MNIDDQFNYRLNREIEKEALFNTLKEQKVSNEDILKFFSRYDQETEARLDRGFLGSNRRIHCIK